MNEIIFPEDVDNVVQEYCVYYENNAKAVDLILDIGSSLLGISPDEMLSRIMN